MITKKNYHYLQRLSKRTIKIFKRRNSFTKVLYQKQNDQKVNDFISSKIKEGKPFMMARYGSIEISAIINFLESEDSKSEYVNIFRHLIGKLNIYWKKDKSFINKLCFNAGFFPESEAELKKFVELMLDCSKNLDILGVWTGLEEYFPTIPKSTKLVNLRDLEPWFFKNPWSENLENKKVLVIHPFEDTIKNQYFNNRTNIYIDNNVLPNFELLTIKAVQTIAGQPSEYETWFDALEYMQKEIDKFDFDIAIIGCGAYGFPLASYIKNKGKQAIHLGGVTQLLFGIKGKRWEEWENYTKLRKEGWVYAKEKPKGAENVEGGCYW